MTEGEKGLHGGKVLSKRDMGKGLSKVGADPVRNTAGKNARRSMEKDHPGS